MIRLPQRETRLLVAVHGWCGALLGLLLYAVIVTGTAAVFAEEIEAWSAGVTGPEDAFARPFDAAARRLADETPAAFQEELTIRPSARRNIALFFHKHETVAGDVKERGVLYEVAPDGGVVSRREGWRDDLFASDRDAALSDFLLNLHIRLHLPNPWGLMLTGILGLAMLVAAVSGLLMHRHLLRDIFTLRGASRLVGLRDAHTVVATWTLPHAFVLAFTGAFFSFASSVSFPMLATVAFNGDQTAFFETLVGSRSASDPTRSAGANLDRVVADARGRAGNPIHFVSVERWGRADAHITIFPEAAASALITNPLLYDGATGAYLGEKPSLGTKPSLGGTAFALAGPLHFGNFAGWWSKAVWFGLGAATATVTWSGLALWVRRRRERWGWRALGQATAWIGGGLPLALAASAMGYFTAAATGVDTTTWTPAAFLAAAAAALPVAIWGPEQGATRLLFRMTGGVLLVLPALRLIAGGSGWVKALADGHGMVPALDVLMVIGGLVCLVPVQRLRHIWLRRSGRGADVYPSPAE